MSPITKSSPSIYLKITNSGVNWSNLMSRIRDRESTFFYFTQCYNRIAKRLMSEILKLGRSSVTGINLSRSNRFQIHNICLSLIATYSVYIATLCVPLYVTGHGIPKSILFHIFILFPLKLDNKKLKQIRAFKVHCLFPVVNFTRSLIRDVQHNY